MSKLVQARRIIAWSGIASILTSGVFDFISGSGPIQPLSFILSDRYVLPLFFALLIALRDESSERLATIFGLLVSLACVVAVFVDLPWGDPSLIQVGMAERHRVAVLTEVMFAAGAVLVFIAHVAALLTGWSQKRSQ